MTYFDPATLSKSEARLSILEVLRGFIGFYNQSGGHLKCGCRPREIEWLTTFLIFSWGFFLILPGNIYPGDAYVSSVSNETLWGIVAILLSVVRSSALIINGHWRRSPVLRMLLSACAAGFWAAEGAWMLIEAQSTSPHSFAFYPILVVAEFLAVYRSAQDSVTYMR